MKMLLDRPQQRMVVALTLIGLVSTATIWFQLRDLENAMKAAGGYGIVDYELAFTGPGAQKILGSWGVEGQQVARASLLVDFGFMPAYALAFAGITLLIARSQTGGLNALGLRLTVTPFIAAALDGIENAFLLSMLGSAAVGSVAPLAAGVAATTKFALLALVLAYWMVGGLAYLVKRR